MHVERLRRVGVDRRTHPLHREVIRPPVQRRDRVGTDRAPIVVLEELPGAEGRFIEKRRQRDRQVDPIQLRDRKIRELAIDDRLARVLGQPQRRTEQPQVIVGSPTVEYQFLDTLCRSRGRMEKDREAFWQLAWARADLARATADPTREKFYAIVAYPDPSGFLHVGHLRGLAYADFLHRFYRMSGRSVFFPTGTHMTGLPAVTFAQKVRLRDPTMVLELEDQGIPESEWGRLEDPEHAGRFLGRSYLEIYRQFGLLIDERAYITTVNPDYRAFIRWQFRRLDGAGALVQAPHFASVCPVCGPVSVDPSETDLSKGGGAEWIIYHTVPFRLDDGRFLLAATLRPETLYGATNVWIAPGVALVTWHLGVHRFLVTAEGGRRLVEQCGGHLGAEVSTEELRAASAMVPITGRRVPIVLSPLVDPSVGTGVVMSVPAHAPADWLAIQELPDHERHRLPPVEPILSAALSDLSPSERELMAGEGVPAERAVRATGATRLLDASALQSATERLYRLELARGHMRADLLGGISVAEARTRVAEMLKSEGTAPEVREFSEPVVCRNGHSVIIAKVPDQWFIRYGDPAWKSKDRDLLARLTVRPEEYQRELPGIIDWLSDRPCTRRGRWLGTPFPKDESWLIEPIADSTLYPAYFPIRCFVSDGEVPASALTDAFFDRAILGIGSGEPSLSIEVQDRVRGEFLYWYPLDLNIAGKEHKKVHFPVFLATHALLLPAPLQPKGFFVHGWLTNQQGAKISKKEVSSKGGAIPPLREAFRRWGADALRLFYATASSTSQDVEWDPDLVDATSERLEDFSRLARSGLSDGGGAPPSSNAGSRAGPTRSWRRSPSRSRNAGSGTPPKRSTRSSPRRSDVTWFEVGSPAPRSPRSRGPGSRR